MPKKVSHSVPSKLGLCAWNINGLKKLKVAEAFADRDNDLSQALENNDIVCLSEIWRD